MGSIRACRANRRKVRSSMVSTASVTAGAGARPEPVSYGQAILHAVATLTARNRRPPTGVEIMAAVGMRSRARFYSEIAALVDDGRLCRLRGSRGLLLPDDSTSGPARE